MKLRALRVRNVGRFVAPAAIEGLSGGLDILADDNEAGKSTLFKAIEAVFQVRHTATGAAVDRLRPYGGGEPLVACDFEAGGGRYRITKQFGRGRWAELADLAAGTTLARGLEAEERLAALIGGADGGLGRLGLLWVGQRRSLEPSDPDQEGGRPKDRGERNALMTAVEGEIAAVTSGDEARLVRARVAALLAPLAGGRQGQPKTGSPFDLALKERERLRAELEQAETAARSTAERVARLERLIAARDQGLDGEALATAKAAAETARQGYEAARTARERRIVADRAEAEAVTSERDAARALADFDRRLAELAELDAAIAAGAADVAEAERAHGEAVARVREAGQALAAVEAEQQRLAAMIEAHEAADRRATLAARLEAASRAQAAATALEDEMTAERVRLGANRVTADAMRAIETAEREVARLADRQAAAAPMVTIAPEPLGAGRIEADGVPVVAERALLAVAPLRIRIQGIGTITVVPAETADGAETARRLAAAVAARDRACGAAGVADLAAAEARRREREASERALDVAGAALARMAPDGAAALGAETERLRRLHAESRPGAALVDAADVSAQLADVVRRRSELSAERDGAAAAERAASEAVTRTRALTGDRTDRRQRLLADLPERALRDSARARLQKAADDAAARAREALRVAVALRETAPADDRVAALSEAARAAEAAFERTTAAARDVEQEIRDLEARLDEAGEAGGGTRVAALAGALARAEGDVRRFEAERRALSMIEAALAAAETELRHRFERPVTERLAPYLGTLFDDASLKFEAGFRAAELVRGGVVEPLERLSDGTREQIAILVRLAFGRLLAETGHPAPVILDDALVYADDRRIRRVFRALEAAAAAHQVIVLTCRTAVFADLAGHRVSVAPWRGG